MKKLTLLLIFSIFSLSSAVATSYRVSSEKEFEEIIPKLAAGDEVIVKNGNYSDWSIEITAKRNNQSSNSYPR